MTIDLPRSVPLPVTPQIAMLGKIGGVTASTELLAAKRHARAHTPVIECKTIIANQEMAYAA